MALVFDWNRAGFGGLTLTLQNRGHWGSRYIRLDRTLTQSARLVTTRMTHFEPRESRSLDLYLSRLHPGSGVIQYIYIPLNYKYKIVFLISIYIYMYHLISNKYIHMCIYIQYILYNIDCFCCDIKLHLRSHRMIRMSRWWHRDRIPIETATNDP